MASGNYATRKSISTEPVQTPVPLRANATRQLPIVPDTDEARTTKPLAVRRPSFVVDEFRESSLKRQALVEPFAHNDGCRGYRCARINLRGFVSASWPVPAGYLTERTGFSDSGRRYHQQC